MTHFDERLLSSLVGGLTAGRIEPRLWLGGHPGVMGDIFEEIRKKLEAHKLGAVAARFGYELLAVVDLEHGRYDGRAVDIAVLDDLASHQNETLLLPSKELREEARRRVIRLQIAASAYPEIRGDGNQVEERVLRQGINGISLLQQPATKASLDLQNVAKRGGAGAAGHVAPDGDVARNQRSQRRVGSDRVHAARGARTSSAPPVPN